NIALHSFPTRRSSDLAGKELPSLHVPQIYRGVSVMIGQQLTIGGKRDRALVNPVVISGQMREDLPVSCTPQPHPILSHRGQNCQDRKSTRLNSSHDQI